MFYCNDGDGEGGAVDGAVGGGWWLDEKGITLSVDAYEVTINTNN